jgi:hypothetical protein
MPVAQVTSCANGPRAATWCPPSRISHQGRPFEHDTQAEIGKNLLN